MFSDKCILIDLLIYVHATSINASTLTMSRWYPLATLVHPFPRATVPNQFPGTEYLIQEEKKLQDLAARDVTY